MKNIRDIILELRESKPYSLNMENFKTEANDDRYYNYLYHYVLGYTKDDGEIFDRIKEKELYIDNPDYYGVYYNGIDFSCIVPKRKTIMDEIISIHEITHLVSALNDFHNYNTTYKEIIPYFNEFEYLNNKQSFEHSFYASNYLIYRMNTSIEAAKRMNKYNRDDCLSYIIAGELLKRRTQNYDINKLNKINAKSRTLEKSLKLNGYTL